MTILEKQQKYTASLQEENRVLEGLSTDKDNTILSLHKKLWVISLLLPLVVASAVWLDRKIDPTRELLVQKTQEAQNWQASAITLSGKYNDSQDEVAYVKQGRQEALEKGFIQKCPPPLILK